jgi:hypothetical protein
VLEIDARFSHEPILSRGAARVGCCLLPAVSRVQRVRGQGFKVQGSLPAGLIRVCIRTVVRTGCALAPTMVASSAATATAFALSARVSFAVP